MGGHAGLGVGVEVFCGGVMVAYMYVGGERCVVFWRCFGDDVQVGKGGAVVY